MNESNASLIFGLILSTVCGVIVASIAARKRRNGLGWFLLGMIFGPIAIMVIVVAPPLRDDADDGDVRPAEAARVDALVKLGGLRDAGTITAEEFELQKARLLAVDPPAVSPKD